MKKLNKIFFSTLFFFFLNFIHSEEINRVLEIAEKADESFSGYGDSKTTLKMMLKDRKGLVTERVMEMRLLEVLEDGDKSLIIINNPRDLRGYAVLARLVKKNINQILVNQRLPLQQLKKTCLDEILPLMLLQLP